MGLFEGLLRDHEDQRHTSILAAAFATRPRLRSVDQRDGFLTPEEAAAVMGVDETELAAMVRRDELESREHFGEVLVRPAVVRRLGFRVGA